MNLWHRDGYKPGLDQPFFLIAGPCVVESEYMTMLIASELKRITEDLDIHFIFKASYDKANRTSDDSFRGLGKAEGLRILSKVSEKLEVMTLTDVHTEDPIGISEVADVVDVLQTPAFLCRQTDFIQTVARYANIINIKKGQFLAPEDMINVVKKAKKETENIFVTERGVSFGYRTLVSDMRSLVILRDTGCPVVFDATHSVQQPGGLGSKSGGQREFVPPLARAAAAVGVSGIFMETHPSPDNALSDGPNSWPLYNMRELLVQLQEIDNVVKN